MDGSALEIRVGGYQFPDGYEISGKRLYPDWLNVDGWARTQAAEWKFSHACLSAGEAIDLRDWLAAIAARQVVTMRLQFTEPNLAFTLIEVADNVASLRINFSHETCPPEGPRDVRLADGYPVTFRIELDQLAAAAAAWDREIALYPQRDGTGV